MVAEKQRFLIVLVATLLMVGVTARLGIWQLDRAAGKRATQAAIEARGKLPALTGKELAADDSQLHRSVLLRGQWLADKTVFLDNRPMNGRVGFFVVTPLQLEGRAEAVLVQRGWLPRHSAERVKLPALVTPAGPVEVKGRLIVAPSRLYEFAPSAAGTAIRQNLAAVAYAEEIRRPLLPLTVLQEQGDDGLARDWPAPDLGLQKHYGYAFQWFALCALLVSLYAWFQIVRPRKNAGPAARRA